MQQIQNLVLFWDRSCWGGRIRAKSCWKCRTRTKSGRARNGDSCRSFSGACHGDVVIFASYEVFFIPEIAWVYYSFQIFLHETSSKEIDALVYGLVFDGAEYCCYIACILFELPSTAAGLSRKPAPSHHFGSVMTHQCWISDQYRLTENSWRGSIQLCLPYYLPLHSLEMNVSSQGEW